MSCGMSAGGAVSKMRTRQEPVLRILFLLYCGLMLWLLFGQRIEGPFHIFPEDAKENINLVPFATVKLYLRLLQNGASQALLRHAVVNLAGNVVMFVPLGWLLPGVWEKLRAFFKTLLLTALLISLVEAVQFATGLGSCDVDDLILNLLGVVLGYGFWRMFHKN